jgi:hypothetical protein
MQKPFNEPFNDFFINRACAWQVACMWRIKPDSVKNGLNPCKTDVKTAL